MRGTAWGLLWTLWLSPLAMAGAEVRSAHLAYKANDFETAARLYEETLGKAAYDAVLHYNLANCRYRLQDWTSAVLHYEKALRLRPWWPDAEHNLRLARARLGSGEEELLENPFLTAGRWVLGLLSLEGWTVLGLVAFSISSLVLAVRLYRGETMFRRSLPWILAVGFGLSVLSLSRVVVFETDRRVLVTAQEAQVFSGPDGTEVLGGLRRGMTVGWSEEWEGWIRVRLPSGGTGWMRMSDLAKI